MCNSLKTRQKSCTCNSVENQSMKRELQEQKDKKIKSENKSNDNNMEMICRHETSGQHNIEDMFAQIVDMKQKVCDLEVKIIDMQKKINEEKELIEERNRHTLANSDQLVQRDEHKESVKDIGYEIMNDN